MRFSFFYFFSFLFLIPLLQAGDEPLIFAKVKIGGWFLGKDRFLHYYILEPGQRFDEAKHTHSLDRITQELHSEGYLDAQVQATRSFDKKKNNVTITLTITQGSLYKIEKVGVAIQGIKDPEKNRLLKVLQPLVGEKLRGVSAVKEQLEAQAVVIRSYVRGEGYAYPAIELRTQKNTEKATVSVLFTIRLDVRKRYLFEGNHFFTTEALMNEVCGQSIHQGDIPSESIRDDLVMLYKKKGFEQIHIRYKKDSQAVRFFIEEGIQKRLLAVRVKGLSADLAQEIREKVEALTRTQIYDQERLDAQIDELLQTLHQIGFIKASLDCQKIYKKKNGDELVIAIIPGKKHLIIGSLIQQWPEVSGALTKAVPFGSPQKPRLFNTALLEQQRTWISDHFRRKGYVYCSVEYSLQEVVSKSQLVTEKSEKNDQFFRIVWKVDTRKGIVRFGKTTIQGACLTKPHTLYRELCYKEGELWDQEKIDYSLNRLKALCMFERVSIEPLEKTENGCETKADFYQPLLIKVVEEDPYEIRTRFGLQFVSKSFTHISWTTYKVGGSFIWKNPAGIADQLRFDADITRFTRNIVGSYDIPWIGSLPVRTTFSAYSNQFDQPLSASKKHHLYKESHDGLSVTFNYAHPRYQGLLNAGFEGNKLFGIDRKLASVIQFEPVLIDKRIPYFYCEPSITIERCDNKCDPQKGFLTYLSGKLMIPFGVSGGAFLRLLFEQSCYYPLFRKCIGAFRFRFGHIFNQKFSAILPTERFYLGGATTLRGYETNMVPPLNDLTCDHTCLWVPVGGKSMANMNLEVRFPLYWLLSGVVFTDMGVLAQDRFADIAANKWLGASGFGLRCATPIGPVRFDMGWKWKKRRPQDTPFAWFVTLGHAF